MKKKNENFPEKSWTQDLMIKMCSARKDEIQTQT